ncbi:MAG TPA: AAA family ATPase [Trebonia sp.]|nr:AAA family ATPase [Trebonia sp.]
MARRTSDKVRELTADELGIGAEVAIQDHSSNRPDDPPLKSDDPRLLEVRDLLQTYGGIIFSGPPGTSKTWYAAKIAEALVDRDEKRVIFVQFHPSYQYEDFIQGFVPKEAGDGFVLKPRYFLQMCIDASQDRERLYVLVIDELSRGDPGRVFGEALTYVDKTKRDMSFTLASGHTCVVPSNLVILATMNPLDRGVDEVDAAFERRFARIAMDPDRGILDNMLADNEVNDQLRTEVLRLFDMMNSRAKSTPLMTVGHTFFLNVRDAASLKGAWKYQIRFLAEKAYRLEPETRQNIFGAWERAIQVAEAAEEAEFNSSDIDGGEDTA